jgi:hypothetical protein
MAWDLECLGKRTGAYLEAFNLLADITIKRLDDSASGAPHSLYRERRSSEKVYLTFGLRVAVDEKPKMNIKGGTGAEVSGDVLFTLYSLLAVGGSEQGSSYDPRESDTILYRGVDYDIVRVERVMPSGASAQMAIQLTGKRYR